MTSEVFVPALPGFALFRVGALAGMRRGPSSTPYTMSASAPPFQVDSNESENNLNGHRAKTPIISAIVSSAAVITIWTVIFLGWLWKQYKKRIRAKRRAAKGLPPKIKKSKKPAPTFIVPPDPAVITGQREPGERVIPRKHHSLDKHRDKDRDEDKDEDKDKGTTSASTELNERSRPITESGARDEMLARQIFSKHSSLDPPRHERRHSRQASKSSPKDKSFDKDRT